jgi:hypothetical protein
VLNNISDTTPVDAMLDRSAEVQTRSSTGPPRDGCGKHPVDPHDFGATISSGRLFLDRDGRHQSPSPLHRRPQHKIIAASNGTNYHRTVTSVLTGCLSRGDHPRLLFHNSIMEKLKLSHWIGSHDTLTSRLRAAKPETELISSVSRKAAYLYSRILLT